VAHHKDAIKRIKQNAGRRMRNRANRTRMRNHIKAVRAAIDTGDHAVSMEALRQAVSTIQGVASKGVIHRNQASRKIARLNAAVKALA
jgi:small subunit ribosomal protein S20